MKMRIELNFNYNDLVEVSIDKSEPFITNEINVVDRTPFGVCGYRTDGSLFVFKGVVRMGKFMMLYHNANSIEVKPRGVELEAEGIKRVFSYDKESNMPLQGESSDLIEDILVRMRDDYRSSVVEDDFSVLRNYFMMYDNMKKEVEKNKNLL